MGKNLKGKNIGRGICQRKDGLYQAKVYLKGNPRPIYLYDANLNRLKQRKKKYDFIKSQDVEIDKAVMTLNEWFDHWIQTVCALHLKDTTIRNHYNNYNRVKTALGGTKLIQLTQMNIQTVINDLTGHYKESTIRSTLNVLSMSLGYAVDNHILLFNPCQGVVVNKAPDDFMPKEKEDRDEDYIEQKTLDLFFDVAKGARAVNYFYILLHTGLRTGELCALQWRDIDFEKRELRVYKTINRIERFFDSDRKKLDSCIKSIKITTPKREASNRIIPMTDGVMEAFEKIKIQQDEDKKKNPMWGSENSVLKSYPDLALTTKKGNCFLPGYIDGECRRLVKILNKREEQKAKEEHRSFESIKIHPHMFRHTFTTNCYEQKLDRHVLRGIVGHSNEKMTQHYTHPGEDFIHSEFQKYENVVNAYENPS